MIDYLPILTTNLYKVQIFCYQTSNWTIYNNSNGRKPKIKQQIFHFFHKNVGIIRHCALLYTGLLFAVSIIGGQENWTTLERNISLKQI